MQEVMKMHSFGTVYEDKRFELLRVGKNRFFLKLKGGLKRACPGLKRITRKEAEILLYEHIKKDLEGSTRVFGLEKDEVARLMKAGVRAAGEMAAEKKHVVSGENAQGG